MAPQQSRPTRAAAGSRWLTLILAAQAAFIAATRLLSPAGWGWGRLSASGTVGVGWLANGSDSYFYDSWAQQAANGHPLFGILYTTTPHVAVYFNPVFYLAGSLARVLGGRPEGWLILMGTAAALALTWLVHRCATALSLGERAASLAAAVAAFGSGWSWMLKAWALSTGTDQLRAADLKFMDFFPSSSALIYPLHTIGQAAVAFALLRLIRLDNRLFGRAPASGAADNRDRLLLGLACAFLGATRPYEPAALLGAFTGYALLLAALGRSTKPLRDRGITLTVMAAALVPFIGYAFWLSRQPVWSGFAALALSLQHPRWFWFFGFGGLWLVGLAGAFRLLRARPSPATFPALWFATALVLLVGLDVPQTKLLSAFGPSLCLCAGLGLSLLFERIARLLPSRAAAIAASSAAGILLAGPFSLGLIAREAILYPPTVDSEVYALAGSLRANLGPSRGLVLCSSTLGEVLPGLAGVRVYAGHWALTDDYDAKCDELKAAGFEDPLPPGSGPAMQRAALLALARRLECRWVVLAKDRPVLKALAGDPVFHLAQGSRHWVLLELGTQLAGEPGARRQGSLPPHQR